MRRRTTTSSSRNRPRSPTPNPPTLVTFKPTSTPGSTLGRSVLSGRPVSSSPSPPRSSSRESHSSGGSRNSGSRRRRRVGSSGSPRTATRRSSASRPRTRSGPGGGAYTLARALARAAAASANRAIVIQENGLGSRPLSRRGPRPTTATTRPSSTHSIQRLNQPTTPVRPRTSISRRTLSTAPSPSRHSVLSTGSQSSKKSSKKRKGRSRVSFAQSAASSARSVMTSDKVRFHFQYKLNTSRYELYILKFLF